MLRRDGPNGFEFDNDPVETYEVGDVRLLEKQAIVVKGEMPSGIEGDAACGKLDGETLLIDRLKKARPHGLLDLKGCSSDAERIRLVQQAAGVFVHGESLAVDGNK